MLKRIRIKNFLGCDLVEMPLGSRNLIWGGIGSGKTSFARACLVLKMVANGAGVDYVGGGFWGRMAPSEISVDIQLPDGRIATYEIVVQQRVGLTAEILHERLFCGGKQLLNRVGAQCDYLPLAAQNSNEILPPIRYNVRAGGFVLPTITATSPDDPFSFVSSFLKRMVVMAPDPVLMTGAVISNNSPIDLTCSQFASRLTAQQSSTPVLYGAFMMNLRSMVKTVQGLSVQPDGRGGSFLVVHRHGGSLIQNFADISSGEKIAMLAAAMRALNVVVKPICCIWDSPMNFIGGHLGEKMIDDFLRDFSDRGQMIFLLPERLERQWDDIKEMKGGKIS